VKLISSNSIIFLFDGIFKKTHIFKKKKKCFFFFENVEKQKIQNIGKIGGKMCLNLRS